ncbi:MAG TPA: YhjD/YihY/BrkB family envelope integrity protein [Burkholderiaceae bacterium]|nr:YhjD/YihY/BrkB family envelope integrity protein [Burkholderiaceae bacterium]
MKRLWTRIWTLLKGAARAFKDDYAQSMGAALAYYTVFSIAPLVFIVILVAGLIFGEEAARGEIFAQLRGLMGEQGASAIQTMVQSVREPATGVIGTIVSVAVLLIGSTTVFAELQDALDRIWRAPVREQVSGALALVRARLLSFGMILGIGFLLIVSLIVSAALAALGKWWGPLLGDWETFAQLLNLALNFALFTTAFALIYKFMPRVKIEWRDVWIGAAVTSLLFSIGKFLIGLYIGKSAIASGFGAAGSIVVVLVWVYYSAQIFLLGAEFTWVYAHEFGSRRGRERPAAAEPVPQRSGAPEPAAAGLVPDGRASAPPARVARRYAPARRTGVDAPLAFGLGCLLMAIVARRGLRGQARPPRRLRWRST